MTRHLLQLLAVLVGILLTVIAFILATFASGACQCSRPITIAFPYSSILWSTGRLQGIGAILMACQFPAYALIVATVRTRFARSRLAFVLMIIHLVAVVIGMIFFKL